MNAVKRLYIGRGYSVDHVETLISVRQVGILGYALVNTSITQLAISKAGVSYSLYVKH